MFHPGLSGATIRFAADGAHLFLASGDLAINGDMNQDGEPDITLGGPLDQDPTFHGHGLSIVSSDNTIFGLSFVDFAYSAMDIECPDTGCGTKLFKNNRIINNIISNQLGGGIIITTLGIRPAEEAPLLSDITWQDTLISGNRIATKHTAIYISPAAGGADRNRMINLTISGNHISSEAAVTMDILVADANSAWFGIPGPIDYSENSLIENLTISGNMIEAPNGFGIHIIGANYGNSSNRMQNVKIRNNTVTNVKWVAINLSAGGAGEEDRGSDNNVISNLNISQNTITQTWEGITIAGAGSGSQLAESNNRVENVVIADNAISGYTAGGIALVGGGSSLTEVSENMLDQITISRNNIQQTINQGWGCGISVIGGQSVSDLGLSLRNVIRGLSIVNNNIGQNATGIQVFGGEGVGAEDNRVIIADISGNTLVGNDLPTDIRDNNLGAIRNTIITLSERLNLPLVLR
jgi:hypothetical protein